MKVKNEINAQRQDEGVSEQRTSVVNDNHAPRNLTLAENVVLTVKVLVGAGLVLAALWGLSRWTSTM